MKLNVVIAGGLLSVLALFAGCKSQQISHKPVKETEVAIPLSGKDYRSDDKFWRVVQSGVSPDMSMAKKVALQNARQEMAATIKAEVKAVIDNYGKNMAVTENIDVVNMYEEQAYTVVDQVLTGTALVGEKLFKLSDGTYRYHVCIEINREYLEQQLEKSFENDARLKAEFDKAQFKKVYDEQMKAFQNSRNQ